MPKVEDALDYLVDTRRTSPRTAAMYGYDLWIPNVTNHYAQTEVPRMAEQPGALGRPASTGPFEWQSVSGAVSPAFLEAAWQLCRLEVLRPGTREINLQSSGDGEGYSITSFGRTWLDEHSSPAYGAG